MAYCTVDDIKNALSERRLIELSNDQDSSSVNTTVVEAAIKKADGVIDAYCRKRYSIPLADPPNVINALSVELSIYFLYSRKSEAPDDIQKRYEKAIEMLEQIAEGKLKLGLPSANSKIQMIEEYTDRVFTMEVLEDASSD